MLFLHVATKQSRLVRSRQAAGPASWRALRSVRPEVVVEVTYLTWTEDNLLRQVSYQGQREDKSADRVVRPVPHPLPPPTDPVTGKSVQ